MEKECGQKRVDFTVEDVGVMSGMRIIFIGMSRVVLRMLQTPSAVPAPRVVNQERLNLSHALGLYAIAASVPLAIFQPAALFDSLRAILATFGVKL